MIIGCDFPSQLATDCVVGERDWGDRGTVGACQRRGQAVLSVTGGAGADRRGSDEQQSVVHRNGRGLGAHDQADRTIPSLVKLHRMHLEPAVLGSLHLRRESCLR